MPHKHKRKRDDGQTDFDLPPSHRAKSLSAISSKPTKNGDISVQSISNASTQKSKRRKPNSMRDTFDDTPKHFARLLAFQQTGKKIRSGLDDGQTTSSKSKQNVQTANANNTSKTEQPTSASNPTQPSSIPKILPHERLADFSRRVDQSLPLTSVPKYSTRLPILPTSNTSSPNPISKKTTAHLTKHNRRLHRMQTEWRNTETKLRQKLEDANADNLDAKEEDDLLWLDVKEARGRRKGKKIRSGVSGGDEDPWRILERKRRDEKLRDTKDVVGSRARQKPMKKVWSSNDVVQAPPVLKPVKNIFRTKEERGARVVVV